GECPTTDEERRLCSKWRNNFNKDEVLFNYNHSKKCIKNCGYAILVEGPLDALALEQAGISGGVAMLGATLSDQQQILLETSGVQHVVLLTDNDEAGRQAKADIKNRLCNICRIYEPSLLT